MRQYKSSKEIEQELKDRGYTLHHRSLRPPSQKQMKMLAMARAREAVAAGEGVAGVYRGQKGHELGCWFVYSTGYVVFRSQAQENKDKRERELVYSERYIERVMHWNGCSRNKAIHLLENGYRLPKH